MLEILQQPPVVPHIFIRLSPARATVVYETYWRFAVERQNIFFRRIAGSREPWTNDPILLKHKFTNVYRASDRVSQYLINHVITSGDQKEEEIFFRIVLFKIFNKIDTWELLSTSLGATPCYRNFSVDRYDKILNSALLEARRIYSAAYIMPSCSTLFGQKRKHANHLRLIDLMMRDRLPQKLCKASRMQDAFEMLRELPSIGDFLAYQYVTDINYSDITNFSEMEFVVPGPGARDGIRKCFASLGGLTEPDLIKFVADRQQEHFQELGLNFKDLFGRPMQLIDCQNVFCEVDKYARLKHPEVQGRTNRTKIKQLFKPTSALPNPSYPPKWGIHELLTRQPSSSCNDDPAKAKRH